MNRPLGHRAQQQTAAEALDERIKSKSPPELAFANILGVSGNGFATISIGGSRKSIRASIPKDSNLSAGDTVVIARNIPGSTLPVVIGAFGGESAAGSGGGQQQQQQKSQIAPPQSITSLQVANTVFAAWQVPVGIALSFEIEFGKGSSFSNLSSSGTAIVKGSYYPLPEVIDGETWWFRLRSWGEFGNASGWSDWYSHLVLADTVGFDDFPLGAQGEILVYGADGVLSALSPGQYGYFLQSRGTEGPPRWVQIDDITSSVKVTDADIVPSYLSDKIKSGYNIDVLVRNAGSNEYLEIAGAKVFGNKVVTVATDGSGDYVTIQNAIDYCATQSPTSTEPWTVLLLPGRYEQGAIEMSSYVNVVGFSRSGTVVKYQSSTRWAFRSQNISCVIANLTIDSTNWHYVSIYHRGTGRLTLSDCNIVLRATTDVGTGGAIPELGQSQLNQVTAVLFAGASNEGGTHLIRNCFIDATHINNNAFDVAGVTTYRGGAVDVYDTLIKTWSGGGNNYCIYGDSYSVNIYGSTLNPKRPYLVRSNPALKGYASYKTNYFLPAGRHAMFACLFNGPNRATDIFGSEYYQDWNRSGVTDTWSYSIDLGNLRRNDERDIVYEGYKYWKPTLHEAVRVGFKEQDTKPDTPSSTQMNLYMRQGELVVQSVVGEEYSISHGYDGRALPNDYIALTKKTLLEFNTSTLGVSWEATAPVWSLVDKPSWLTFNADASTEHFFTVSLSTSSSEDYDIAVHVSMGAYSTGDRIFMRHKTGAGATLCYIEWILGTGGQRLINTTDVTGFVGPVSSSMFFKIERRNMYYSEFWSTDGISWTKISTRSTQETQEATLFDMYFTNTTSDTDKQFAVDFIRFARLP